MKTASSRANKTVQDRSVLRTALMELQSALRKIYGAQAPTLMLYGSYARGDASEDSDVDVVLLYSTDIQPGQEIHQLREILSVLNLRYQILISVLPVSARHFRVASTAFWKNVRQEAVSIDRL